MKIVFNENYICSITVSLLNCGSYLPRWIFEILTHYYSNSKLEREIFLEKFPSLKKSNTLKIQKLDDDLEILDFPDDYNLLGMEVLDFIDKYPQWRDIVKEVKFGLDPEKPECLK